MLHPASFVHSIISADYCPRLIPSLVLHIHHYVLQSHPVYYLSGATLFAQGGGPQLLHVGAEATQLGLHKCSRADSIFHADYEDQVATPYINAY